MLRPLVQKIAHSCGLSVVSLSHVGLRFLDHPPHTLFDHVLLHCFSGLQGLNFIQVGANDGERADPIAAYVGPCTWSGLMFEPLAANHAELIRRHGGNPLLQIRRMAVDLAGGSRQMYDLARDAHPNLPDWAHGLGSFSRDRVANAVHELGLDDRAIVAEEVACMAWSEVWVEFGVRRCDVLVLDTEGYDLVLLRAASLQQHRPRIVHFEHACVDVADRMAFYRDLLDLGYEITSDGPDTTAWLKS